MRALPHLVARPLSVARHGEKIAARIRIRSAPLMKTTLFFFFRLYAAWVASFLALLVITSIVRHEGPPATLLLVLLAMLAFVTFSGVSHLNRVRLMSDQVDSSTLANRQRRQIEIPFDANEAFAMVEAAIRELPRSEEIAVARDSLQARAKVGREPYGTSVPFVGRLWRKIGMARNQVHATVSPLEGSSSVRLVCEPEGRSWCDWFFVDDGTNLENANALTRAISRRIVERRKLEAASAQETVTEKELAVAKLGLLQAQVEPHFLYNTLGSAKYLIKSDPAKAEAMIDNLIVYLRHSLPRTDDTPSTLGDEVKRVQGYLEILQIRMGARLTPHIDVPEALRSLPFPSMMLQTLVENAIKHGLEPKSGGGNIWVLARETAEGIAVTVADDGIGFGHGTEGTGVGLNNVRERLKLAHGEAARFSIAVNFPTGVAATIVVPKPATSAGALQ
jgi:signal transduction histidine kinase